MLGLIWMVDSPFQLIGVPMNLGSFKARSPWWGKMIGRILISFLPFSYKFWHRLGVFEHGRMEDPSYAYNVFTHHFNRVEIPRRSAGFICLELGPGDSVSSAVIAHAFGASACYLVDAGDFAQHDVRLYKKVAAFLVEKGLPAPSLDHAASVKDVLATCNATYGTAGLASLKAIPTSSVDFIWSHGALQSVRRREFPETIGELRRIVSDDGTCSHAVPLCDLLVNALNDLRFPEFVWEVLARPGFYTNRLRYSEMLAAFRIAGFNVDVVQVKRWDRLPTPRRRLDRQFRAMSDDELRVSSFEAVLTPA